jgi:uncharacterized protein YggT (Ycf19 family)
MFIFSIIDGAVSVYLVLIVIRATMSWLKPEVIYAYAGFFRIVEKIVDPLLNFVRKVFPANMGGMDLSPVIAMLFVETMKYLLFFIARLLIAKLAA